MTHLAQQSGRLPDSMMLDGIDLVKRNGQTVLIGSGSFADVYVGVHRRKGEEQGELVAVKQLRLYDDIWGMPQRIRVCPTVSFLCSADKAHTWRL